MTSIIEICKVNANSDFTIEFLNGDNIADLFRVFDLPNQSHFLEFAKFDLNGFP